jgi:aspartyl-tRNA(Asn)/glutamyl-tRNA(Gln) amidotransferase subunit C
VRADLARIIDMVDQMQRLATDGVEPLAHPLGRAPGCAPTGSPKPSTAKPSSVAPAVADGLYLVPRVVE